MGGRIWQHECLHSLLACKIDAEIVFFLQRVSFIYLINLYPMFPTVKPSSNSRSEIKHNWIKTTTSKSTRGNKSNHKMPAENIPFHCFVKDDRREPNRQPKVESCRAEGHPLIGLDQFPVRGGSLSPGSKMWVNVPCLYLALALLSWSPLDCHGLPKDGPRDWTAPEKFWLPN